MSGVSLPVTRSVGRALIIGSPLNRAEPLGVMRRLGFQCAESDDPYAGMAELARRPLAYRAVILSLSSLYREELPLVGAVKRHWPHVEIWLTQSDGRQAALADAMRLGADGLLSEDGLHRTAVTEIAPSQAKSPLAITAMPPSDDIAMANAVMPNSVTPKSAPPWKEATTPQLPEADTELPADSVLPALEVPASPHAAEQRSAAHAEEDEFCDVASGDPVLSAEELRALLQDQPPQSRSSEGQRL